MILKKLNKILEAQGMIVLRSKDKYASKDNTCSEKITEQAGVSDKVEGAEKCGRQWRPHLQKLLYDRLRQQYSVIKKDGLTS